MGNCRHCKKNNNSHQENQGAMKQIIPVKERRKMIKRKGKLHETKKSTNNAD